MRISDWSSDVCSSDLEDFDHILHIINCAAEAYRGVIPPDRWHEPYMPAEALASEMADGVVFSACIADGRLIGVMGVQDRGAVDLIRHAYVIPEYQGAGIGSRSEEHTSELQSLMRISYAVFCLKKKK